MFCQKRAPCGFAVDFDVRDGTKDKNGKLVIELILDHFKIVKQTIGDEYRVGAYANGYVNRVLRDEGLIVFSWVSPSRSFAETPAYISSGQWHLFQNKVDRRWFGTAGKCPSGLGVDTNVQNPAYPYIGAWGGEAVAPERTKAIFDQRRFALKATVVYSAKNDNGLPAHSRPMIAAILPKAGQRGSNVALRARRGGQRPQAFPKLLRA